MKFLKISIFVLALGFVAASCGSNTTDDTVNTEDTMSVPMDEEAQPQQAPDTTNAAPGTTPDSANAPTTAQPE